MSSPRWTTRAGFKTFAGVTVTSDDTNIDNALAAAENQIGLACRRDFATPTGGATTRTYVPAGDAVKIDDLAALTGVQVANFNTTQDLTAVQWEPLNGVGPDGRTGWPYTQIRQISGTWQTFRGQATVAVTSAYWGWTATPDAIIEATYLLAKDILNSSKQQFGQPVDQYGQPFVDVATSRVVADLVQPFIRTRQRVQTFTVTPA